MNILNRVAIITGGASGMGRACAEALLLKGAQVMVWDKQTSALDCHSIQCDVASAESVEAALAETISQLGLPEISINCAGIAPSQRMTGKQGVMPLAAFQHVIDINLIGTFNVMRTVADAMIHIPGIPDGVERGIIINTASIAAFEGQIGQVAYSASKGGIVAMTLPAARELAQHGIRVNTIAPGLIATPLLLGMPEAVRDTLAATVPFPKRLGAPEEFSALVLHMIENSYLNGEVIRLDGALRMQAR